MVNYQDKSVWLCGRSVHVCLCPGGVWDVCVFVYVRGQQASRRSAPQL